MLEQAEDCVTEKQDTLCGEVIRYAYDNNHHAMAKAIIQQSTPAQIAAAPGNLLFSATMNVDYQTMIALAEKGIRPGNYAETILSNLLTGSNAWMAEHLLESGMQVELDDYAAFNACVQNDSLKSAKLLLDQGMDLEQYKLWAADHGGLRTYTDTLSELQTYWDAKQEAPTQEQDDGPSMTGMQL
jgi:hypothetical protein